MALLYDSRATPARAALALLASMGLGEVQRFARKSRRGLRRCPASTASTCSASPSVRTSANAARSKLKASRILALDRELIADRLFGAVTFVYAPSWARDHATGAWERAATTE